MPTNIKSAKSPKNTESINGSILKSALEKKQLEKFLNVDYGIIGRTAATKYEPHTSTQFHLWLTSAERTGGEQVAKNIEIGNIVAALSDTYDEVTFGTVVEMRVYADAESFLSDFTSHDFGDAGVEVPTDVAEVVVVTCDVLRNFSARAKPVGRSRVYYPSAQGIQYAFNLVDEDGNHDAATAPIPLGLYENGDGTVAAIAVDEAFLVGPEGAHINVSGISGLASKTSALQFLTLSLLTHSKKRLAVLAFNVKSKDLLYLDQANPRLLTDSWSLDAYRALDIPPRPLTQARFFAPADPTEPTRTQSLRRLPTQRIEWDLASIYRDIPTLFNPLDWDDKLAGVWSSIEGEIEHGNILSYAQMLTWIDRLIDSANNARPPQQWVRGNHISTWLKARSHLQRFPLAFKGLIATAGAGTDIPWSQFGDRSVYVIDIQMLSDAGKRLVFSRAINAVREMLEAGTLELDGVLVIADELNKFAPATGERSPLKEQLVDITARGRSIGLILCGAEQFVSSVDKQIVENSATHLYGRTGVNELRAPNYSALSDEVKGKLSTLAQGRLLVQSARLPQSVFMRFPLPPCVAGDQFQP